MFPGHPRLFLDLKVQRAFFLVGELLARNVGFSRDRAAIFTFKRPAQCVEDCFAWLPPPQMFVA